MIFIKDMEEAINLHKEKFGVEPIFTGMTALEDEPPIMKIARAIADGKPYVEEEVSDENVV